MNKRFSVIAFLFALTAGVSLSSSEKISDLFHHECTNWSQETLARPLFTLEEGQELLGKKARLTNSKLYPQNARRIEMLEMVGQDKFLIVVDWDVDPYEGKESLRLYDKEILSNLAVEN